MKEFRAKTIKIKTGSLTIFPELCKGCGICIEKCPFKALELGENDLGVYSTPTPEVDTLKCTLCKICEIFCPDCALRVEKTETADEVLNQTEA